MTLSPNTSPSEVAAPAACHVPAMVPGQPSVVLPGTQPGSPAVPELAATAPRAASRAPRSRARAAARPVPGRPSRERCPVTAAQVRRAPVRPRLIRELPPEERPRERLAARGPAGLSNAELVALIWGSGAAGHSAVELASEAVATHGGIAGLAGAGVVELESLPGVGSARACQLVAAFELGRRLLADWPSGRFTVRTPRDLADRLVLQMGRLDREELRVVLLNTKNQDLDEVWTSRAGQSGPLRTMIGGRPYAGGVVPHRAARRHRQWIAPVQPAAPGWASRYMAHI